MANEIKWKAYRVWMPPMLVSRAANEAVARICYSNQPPQKEKQMFTTTLDAPKPQKTVNLATLDPATQLSPAPYRLVIEAYESGEIRSASGLTLSTGGKQEHVWRVLAVGEKVTRGAVGDLILCGQYNGIKIVIAGREIHIISQKEVFAIIEV